MHAPCDRCGTPDGYAHPRRNGAPDRIRVDKLGFAGVVCHKCYCLLYARHKQRLGRNHESRPRFTRRDPCARCGNEHGYAHGRAAPIRVSAARYGVEGMVCHACYCRARNAWQKEHGVQKGSLPLSRNDSTPPR